MSQPLVFCFLSIVRMLFISLFLHLFLSIVCPAQIGSVVQSTLSYFDVGQIFMAETTDNNNIIAIFEYVIWKSIDRKANSYSIRIYLLLFGGKNTIDMSVHLRIDSYYCRWPEDKNAHCVCV